MKSARLLLSISIIGLLILTGCVKKQKVDEVKQNITSSAKVTFIELGSVKCVPCKMMVPVMKQVEEKFKDQVAVLFYDVWTPEGQPYGQQYGIRAIPTQVFLDSGGKEYYRHEGFFPYEELVKVLEQKGVK